MKRLLVLLLVFAVAGEAQKAKKSKAAAPKPAAPAPARVWPLETIDFEGLRRYRKEQLLPLLGLKLGMPVDKPAFEAARDRLAAAGVFASVAFRYGPSASGKGYALTYEVVEIEQAYPIRFERLGVVDAELRAHLKQTVPLFSERIPATKPVMDGIRRQIEEFLARKGQPAAVTGKLAADRPDEMFVLFYPAGAPPVVARVAFVNNKIIPATQLQNTIQGVAVGTEYREDRFRELLDSSIRPLYEARGRLRLAFPKIEVAAAGDVKGVAVTVHVEEGPAFDLGSLAVDGVEGFNEELARTAGLKVGDLASFDAVKEGMEKVARVMRRNGHMRVRTRPERKLNDEKKTVDVVIHVEPGPRYTFRKLFIQGLDIHGEAQIKRLWGMDPGKPYNNDYPAYFLDRIREENVFDNLGKPRVVVKEDDQALTVDVTLVFR